MGIIPAVVVSVISTINSSNDVTHKVYNQLTAINQIKKQAVINYFNERKGDMGVLVDIADTMQEQTFSQLTSINELKKVQIESYFKNNLIQLDMLANDNKLQNAITKLTNDFSNTTKWRLLLDEYDKEYKPLLSYFGWYYFFIISNRGTILYSVTRESDLGQKIPVSLKDSSFNKAYSLAKQSDSNEIQLGDFLPYAPSNKDPAVFAVKPVSVNGKRVG